jgi:hypothetical protein
LFIFETMLEEELAAASSHAEINQTGISTDAEPTPQQQELEEEP